MKKQHKGSRRGFLKKSALAGLGASGMWWGVTNKGAGAADAKPGKKKSFSLFRKEYDSIDEAYEISPDYQRFDQKNTIYGRLGWQSHYRDNVGASMAAKFEGFVPDPLLTEKEYGPIAKALSRGAWAGHDEGAKHSNVGVSGYSPLNDWDKFTTPKRKEPYVFESPEEAKKYIKRAAIFLGADEVGIAPYDERWTYSKEMNLGEVFDEGVSAEEVSHKPIQLPFEVRSIIVIALEMDYDALRCGGHLNDATVGLEYSHMTEVTHKIAVFLNHLGYKAIPTGNDVGINVPIAIQAGLGENSRMGMLITEKHGSRTRTAKVYTDLELPTDKPISFGVQEFCIKCKKCAEACPADAISLEDEPTLAPSVNSISCNPGVRKWYQDNEKCFDEWERKGTGCGICITVCPYNKLDNWVHWLSEQVVSAPVGRDIARQLDDAFGYGEMGPQHVDDFWNKDD